MKAYPDGLGLSAQEQMFEEGDMNRYEEERRHRCECREWLRRRGERGKEWLQQVLDDIEKRRGKQAADRLRSDLGEQWAKGNRGEPGDWR